MGTNSTNPFTSPSISGYNTSPPADDGSEVESNRVKWSVVRSKLTDVLKTFAEAIVTNVATAFGSVLSLATDVTNLVSGQIGFEPSELTISSGAVTPTRSRHTVDTEANASTDNLDTLTTSGSTSGAVVILSADHTDRTVVCRHQQGSAGTGRLNNSDNINYSLNDTDKMIAYELRSDDDWYELWRTSPGQLRGYIGGLALSNDTDADHDINVTSGEASDSTNATILTLSSEITKQIDATWAAGDDAGGLSSSLSAPAINTGYYVFLISVAGSVDVGFDTSLTAANLVADHSATAYRRIGWVLTDGSANILGFVQQGDLFLWKAAQIEEKDGALQTGSRELLTVAVPPNSLGVFSLELEAVSAASCFALLTHPSQTDSAASENNFTEHTGTGLTDAGNRNGSQCLCPVDASSQVGLRGSAADQCVLNAVGYFDRRGRDD